MALEEKIDAILSKSRAKIPDTVAYHTRTQLRSEYPSCSIEENEKESVNLPALPKPATGDSELNPPSRPAQTYSFTTTGHSCPRVESGQKIDVGWRKLLNGNARMVIIEDASYAHQNSAAEWDAKTIQLNGYMAQTRVVEPSLSVNLFFPRKSDLAGNNVAAARKRL
ncbi:uncharacterized protein EV420DRAFT_1482495 [Desarmillaria tabescens]|uniref:Uncharacterized protein n=1 Tax=Armillaria tabescens TaxID=1929756 RepID=A0AA39MZ95_ARMTA|nr:uncharacterized protein EV420DRAFT_1482495 [Desarmillaria tabescens]KAK0451385.1 hypothetical protein EV420DRAFT_1482495 [Desarmillaria tabescens]